MKNNSKILIIFKMQKVGAGRVKSLAFRIGPSAPIGGPPYTLSVQRTSIRSTAVVRAVRYGPAMCNVALTID